MATFVPGLGYVGSAQYNIGLANQTYSPQQLQIARSIAASQVPSAFPAGGSSRIGSWVAEQTAKIANELFKQPEPAAAPAPAPAPPAPAPQQQLQIAQLNEQSEAYRKQSEEQLAAANATIANLSNEELQRQRAAELQNRLAIQAASSQARGMAAPSLKIASATPQTAGTQAFKRRRDQATMAPIQSTAGINVPTGSVLNI